MKTILTAFFFLLVSGLWSATLATSDLPRAFLDGVEAYQQKKYNDAAVAFKKITDSGVQNGHLYYNLGNVYLKMDDIGRAILWYERARKLIPNDPDLAFNLDYARSLVKDEPAGEASVLYRILFFWNYLLSHRTIIWGAVACNALFWGFLSVYIITPRRFFRRAAIPAALFALLLTGTACYNYFEARYRPKAVVLAEALPVRSGLSEEATELFVLHAGSRVQIKKERDGFFRIYFSEGKIGWVKKDGLGVI